MRDYKKIVAVLATWQTPLSRVFVFTLGMVIASVSITSISPVAGMAQKVAESVIDETAEVAAATARSLGGFFNKNLEANESPALQSLPAGTTVAIYSHSKKKYLKLEKSGDSYKYLKATGESKDDPFCQFEVIRLEAEPNWIGFRSLRHFGYVLQVNMSNPERHDCRFENGNFAAWEKWALIPESPTSLDSVFLCNQASKGFLSVHPDNRFEGFVTTNYKKGSLAGQGPWERLKIEIVAPLQPTDRPGGSDFIYRRFMRKAQHLSFSDKWKFKSTTKGIVKFRALAPRDIYVGFSPVPAWSGDRTYWFAIGGWDNTKSCLFKNWVEIESQSLNENDPKKVAATLEDMVTGGWGLDGFKHHNGLLKTDDIDWEVTGNYKGNTWGDYWASYEIANGKIKFAWGKGKVAGKNVRMRHKVDNPALPELGYLGLGGHLLNVEFKEIQIDPVETEDEQVISAIPGFELIEGVAQRLSIGGQKALEKGKDNRFLAMMVERATGKLFKMDSTTMGGWEPVVIKVGDKLPEKFFDVSVAADGSVGALADTGELFFSYNGGKDWKSFATPLVADKPVIVDRVAVASKHLVVVLDKESGDIFKHEHKDKGSWKRIASGHAMSIAPGYPDILIAVNKSLDCYQLKGLEWIEFPNPHHMGRLAIKDLKNMYGTVERDGRYYLNKLENGVWAPVLDAAGKPVQGIKDICTNTAGALLVMTIKGQILKQGTLDKPLVLDSDSDNAKILSKESTPVVVDSDSDKTKLTTKGSKPLVVESDSDKAKIFKKESSSDLAKDLQIPGFVKMDGSAARIALGAGHKGNPGEFIGLMISKDERALFKRSHPDERTWKWEPVVIKVGDKEPTKFVDVAVSGDRLVGALSESGELFVSTDDCKTWKTYGVPRYDGVPVVGERLAIASKHLIVILDKQTGDLFLRDKQAKDGWKRLLDGDVMAVAAAYPDILIAIDKSRECRRLVKGKWIDFKNPLKLGRLAIVDMDRMYGIQEKEGRTYLHKISKGSWIPVMDSDGSIAEGIKQVSVNASGGMWLLTTKGQIFRKERPGKGLATKNAVKENHKKSKPSLEKKTKKASKGFEKKSKHEAGKKHKSDRHQKSSKSGKKRGSKKEENVESMSAKKLK